MSKREYHRIMRQLKPFTALLIVIAGTAFLASCGGGDGVSSDPTVSSATADGPTMRAQAVSGSATVPGTWKGRVPPRINNASPKLAIPSPQGPIAANLLLLEIKPGKDSIAASFIEGKNWSVVGKNDEIVKVSVVGESYQALEQARAAAEASGLFSLAEFIGYFSIKPFTTPDPSLNDGAYWNYDAIDARQAWATVGGLPALNSISVEVLDAGFSVIDMGDLHLSSVYNSIGSACDVMPDKEQTICNHGYHVSGIVAATGNDGIGHVGIASGYTNKVAVRAGVASADDGLVVALRDEVLAYTGELKASVVSMSLGNPISSDTTSLNEDEFAELVAGARRSSRLIRSTIERRMLARTTSGLSNEVLFVQASGNEGKVTLPTGKKSALRNSSDRRKPR